jgi:hypothetical protein
VEDKEDMQDRGDKEDRGDRENGKDRRDNRRARENPARFVSTMALAEFHSENCIP